jgi:hypothetical protein
MGKDILETIASPLVGRSLILSAAAPRGCRMVALVRHILAHGN